MLRPGCTPAGQHVAVGAHEVAPGGRSRVQAGDAPVTGELPEQGLRQRRMDPGPTQAATTAGKRVALGMLWGWMPCGLSTTLLAAAWLQASASHGALTMAAFGLGTLPTMIPLTWAGARFGQRLQRGPWRTGAGALVIASGVLTIAAPWLMRLPLMHGVLEALGCRSLA